MTDRFTLGDKNYVMDKGKVIRVADVIKLLNNLNEENEIFRTFIELNDFDADEILLQGKGLEWLKNDLLIKLGMVRWLLLIKRTMF